MKTHAWHPLFEVLLATFGAKTLERGFGMKESLVGFHARRVAFLGGRHFSRGGSLPEFLDLTLFVSTKNSVGRSFPCS